MPRGNTLSLLVIGRLEPMKGHLRLLQALSRLVRIDWTLSIVGIGSMDQAIRAEIRKLGLTTQVIMTGSIKDVRPVYERSDLVVIPSLYEGLPNVLIEALACGCPVLVADGPGGTTEFMKDLGLGDFIIEGDFVSGFATGVDHVMKSDRVTWLHAYERLVAQVHPETVANQVWDFLTTFSQSSV
jgi:glycosyltransferase involved in cell wall biosynthesis